MPRQFYRDFRDEYGAVATEYGVLLGFVVLVIVAGVGMYGTNLNAFITRLAQQIAGFLGG